MINDGEITVVKASKRNNEKHEKMRNSQRKGKGKRRSGVSLISAAKTFSGNEKATEGR